MLYHDLSPGSYDVKCLLDMVDTVCLELDATPEQVLNSFKGTLMTEDEANTILSYYPREY